MFKNFLSASPPVPVNSSVPSPSSSSPKESTIPRKIAPDKDNQVSSWTKLHQSKQETKEIVDTEDGKDDVPELIAPPYPPSMIEMRSSGTKDDSSSLSKHYSGHIRDNSIETTVSQSMDLSSFIKSLELQQEEEPKQQQLGPDNEEKTPERSFRVGDSPHSGSLSLAASQVDISLASETDDIQPDSDTYETDNEICRNSSSNKTEDIRVDSDSDSNTNDDEIRRTSTSKRTTSEKPKIDDNTKPFVLEGPNDVSMVDHSSLPSPSLFPTAKNSSHDLYTMANVGEHLFRESLVFGNGEKDKKEEQTNDTTNISDETLLKGNSTNKLATKMAMVLVIIVVAFVFSGCGNTRPNDVLKTTALSTRCELMREECQPSYKSNSQVPDTTSRSEKSNREQFPIEKENNNDKIDLISDDSLHYLHEERKNYNDDEVPNFSKVDGYRSHDWTGSENIDQEQVPIEKSSNANKTDPISDESSNYGYEESKDSNDDELPNSSKIGGVSNRSIIVDSLAWPMVLLLMASCLFFSFRSASVSSSSLFQEKPKVGAKMDPVTPSTPSTRTSRHRKDNFLTPPLPCKNRVQEPAEWMSPVYSIDVSVYLAMKSAEIRELLRDRKCDTRGTKEQMVKVLVQSYQAELACLTVKKLRPKLKKRDLCREGTKKDMIRRLVEAGPI